MGWAAVVAAVIKSHRGPKYHNTFYHESHLALSSSPLAAITGGNINLIAATHSFAARLDPGGGEIGRQCRGHLALGFCGNGDGRL